MFLGIKTMAILFLKPDIDLTYDLLSSLHTRLSRQVPILSQLLDQVVSKQPQTTNSEEPLRFFYFSRMNLAIKMSNLQNKEVFSLDLKLIIN